MCCRATKMLFAHVQSIDLRHETYQSFMTNVASTPTMHRGAGLSKGVACAVLSLKAANNLSWS